MKGFKNKTLAAVLLSTSTLFFAQQGRVGINTVQPKATLDINPIPVDKAKGLLLPRLTGDQIKEMTPDLSADQNSMLVYATQPVTTGDESTSKITFPSFYRFNFDASTNPAKKTWITTEPTGLERLKEGNNIGWRLIGNHREIISDISITTTYGNIGQYGVDLSHSPAPYSMDMNNIGNIQYYKLVLFGFGYYSGPILGATGRASFVAGAVNQASGDASTALGAGNKATGHYSLSAGKYASAKEEGSVAIGHNVESNFPYEVALGTSNTGLIKPSASYFFRSRIFTLGNGNLKSEFIEYNDFYSDAFTILKNAQVGIGINNLEETASDAKLQVSGAIQIGEYAALPDNAPSPSSQIPIICNSANEGSMRYRKVDANNGVFEGCKKTGGTFAWISLTP